VGRGGGGTAKAQKWDVVPGEKKEKKLGPSPERKELYATNQDAHSNLKGRVKERSNSRRESGHERKRVLAALCKPSEKTGPPPMKEGRYLKKRGVVGTTSQKKIGQSGEGGSGNKRRTEKEEGTSMQ